MDVAKYQATAEEYMKPVTAFTGPTTGPKAAAGKKVVFVACGFAAEGCNLPGRAAVEAGKALGWDVTAVDGKFDPAVQGRLIQEAIDAGADGIIIDAISAEAVAEPIKKAREAGIVVGSYDSLNVPSDTGVSYDVQASATKQGEAMGSYMVWQTNGDAKAIFFNSPEFKVTLAWSGAAEKTIADCATCTVLASENFTAGEASTRLPQLTSTIGTKYSDANVLIAGYDAAMLDSVPAMKQAGLLDRIKVGTFNGISPAIDLVRKGDLTATVGGAMEWGTWAALDNMNRMLSGEQAVEQNVPIRLITAQNVETIQEGGPWTGDVDFRAAYEKIWNGA